MSVTAPSSYVLQQVVALAQQAIVAMEHDDGLVFDSEGTGLIEALADEGVDVATIIRRLVRASLQARADIVAAEHRIADLRARRDRFRKREEHYRVTVGAVMEALSVSKFIDPEFSLSLSAGRPKVHITDALQIPSDMVEVTVLTTPDKALIKAAFDRGEDVPGAMLSQAPPTLTLRTK